MKNLCLCLVTFCAVACVHSVHQQHIGGFNGGDIRGKYDIVKASDEQFVVLGFAYDTSFVERAYKKLLDSCPRDIVGVSSEYSTSLGFFSWTNRLKLKGLCLK